jgi:hypothetical protein
MNRDKTPWHQSDNPDRVGRAVTGRATALIVWFVVVAGLLSAAFFGIRWLVSDVRGQAEADIQINSAANRIAAQQWFPAQLGSIKSTDAKLDGLYALWQANIGKADESWHQTNYIGTQNLCLQFIENYNAEAQKVTREKWIDPSMPLTIDKSDPATDCRATKEPKR